MGSLRYEGELRTPLGNGYLKAPRRRVRGYALEFILHYWPTLGILNDRHVVLCLGKFGRLMAAW